MNWHLIFLLSLFGLAMGFATVFIVPSNIEPLCWLAIFLVCAYVVARNVSHLRFLHGLAIGLVNSVWVTAAHLIVFVSYVAGHMREASMMKGMLIAHSPRLTMAAVGPVIGLISGVVMGLLCVLAGKLIRG